MIKLHNTLTRRNDKFTPIKKGEVGIYSCGPTVYWNQHIGNMYAYIQWDTMVRFFRYIGLKVKWVMNITDVGHMTSDADAGDDKMEKGAKREGITVWQIADKYINQFMASVDSLNIQHPDVLCRATEHIQDQIDLIKKIEANGFTYKTKTGLVFDTSKFPGYADFAHLDLSKQDAGARVEVDPDKKSPWDFLLWVTNQPNHLMQWDSPWGRGFPGWHIECTAMSTKYLGESFDIHTGGQEHIAVHHTNEIAQGFGAFGHQTAGYWLHNAWLTLKDGKMSKSLGNVYTVQDLAAKGFDPISYRYLVLTSHYRKGLVFSWDALLAAQTAYNRLKDMMSDWKTVGRKEMGSDDPQKIDQYRQRFLDRIADDLNYPEAMAILWEVVKSDIPAPDKRDLLLEFDQIFGLRLDEEKEQEAVPDEIVKLAEKRKSFRDEKKWDEADGVRKQIESLGWEVKDTPAGFLLKKIS